jgi:hypothetical protein
MSETDSGGPSTSAPKRPPFWRPLLRTATTGVLLGCTIYGIFDVAGEYSTYLALRNKAMELAESDTDLKEQIGHPFTLGPWYNSKIGFAAGGNVAQCSFQVIGQRQITDVSVRGVRMPGTMGAALYNLLGPAKWTLLDCNAMFPAGGGQVRPKSLIPPGPLAEHDPALDAGGGSSAAAAAAAHGRRAPSTSSTATAAAPGTTSKAPESSTGQQHAAAGGAAGAMLAAAVGAAPAQAATPSAAKEGSDSLAGTNAPCPWWRPW